MKTGVTYFVSSVQGNRFFGILDLSALLHEPSSSSELSAAAGEPSNPLETNHKL